MVTLSEIVAHMLPNAVPVRDYYFANEGAGEVLVRWDEAALGPRPTLETLETFRAAAQAAHDAVLADDAAREAKRQLVAQAIPTLRQWAAQLEGVTVTSGNAVATLQALIDRQEVFYASFANLLEALRIDQ